MPKYNTNLETPKNGGSGIQFDPIFSSPAPVGVWGKRPEIRLGAEALWELPETI